MKGRVATLALALGCCWPRPPRRTVCAMISRRPAGQRDLAARARDGAGSGGGEASGGAEAEGGPRTGRVGQRADDG
jgi:hypothetical protein